MPERHVRKTEPGCSASCGLEGSRTGPQSLDPGPCGAGHCEAAAEFHGNAEKARSSGKRRGRSLCRSAPRALPCTHHAPAARHTPDDPAEYAVSGNAIFDGLSAPARSRTRARADAGRRLTHVIPALVHSATHRAHGRHARPPRTARSKARPGPAADRSLSQARDAVRQHRGADDSLPATPGSELGPPYRRARIPSRRAAFRALEPPTRGRTCGY